MKSIINDGPTSKYPCLKKYEVVSPSYMRRCVVVLFTTSTNGTVVSSDCEENPVGTFKNDWIESKFVHFNGSITLVND